MYQSLGKNSLSSKLCLTSTTYLTPSLFLPLASWSHAQAILHALISCTSGQIWCCAQKATHSSVSLMPPISVPEMVQWLIYISTWLNSIGCVTRPSWHSTPCFFRQRSYRIKSHDYANALREAESEVQQNSIVR